jgi:hypothetical protein
MRKNRFKTTILYNPVAVVTLAWWVKMQNFRRKFVDDPVFLRKIESRQIGIAPGRYRPVTRDEPDIEPHGLDIITGPAV